MWGGGGGCYVKQFNIRLHHKKLLQGNVYNKRTIDK